MFGGGVLGLALACLPATADAADWLATPPNYPPLHPGVVALLQVLVSVTALVGMESRG